MACPTCGLASGVYAFEPVLGNRTLHRSFLWRSRSPRGGKSDQTPRGDLEHFPVDAGLPVQAGPHPMTVSIKWQGTKNKGGLQPVVTFKAESLPLQIISRSARRAPGYLWS